MGYTHGNIEIKEGVSNGIEFLYWGDLLKPTIVYLHGIGERGNDPNVIINQGPFRAGWNAELKKREGFFHPEFFTKGISIVAPQLKSGSWTPGYINQFLDGLNIPNKILAGWSWGGCGVADYMNQPIKKHKFKGAILIATGNYDKPGLNFDVPTKAIHTIDDSRTPVSNTDKIWSGIPEQFKVSYERTSGNNHFIEASFWNVNTGIYEWINSLFEPVVEQEGKLFKIGNEIYGVFGNERIKLN